VVHGTVRGTCLIVNLGDVLFDRPVETPDGRADSRGGQQRCKSRQMNRRVEIIVSGDVIETQIGPKTETMTTKARVSAPLQWREHIEFASALLSPKTGS
jgi:hypothetical protein